jgi:hypothetical protein
VTVVKGDKGAPAERKPAGYDELHIFATIFSPLALAINREIKVNKCV